MLGARPEKGDMGVAEYFHDGEILGERQNEGEEVLEDGQGPRCWAHETRRYEEGRDST